MKRIKIILCVIILSSCNVDNRTETEKLKTLNLNGPLIVVENDDDGFSLSDSYGKIESFKKCDSIDVNDNTLGVNGYTFELNDTVNIACLKTKYGENDVKVCFIRNQDMRRCYTPMDEYQKFQHIMLCTGNGKHIFLVIENENSSFSIKNECGVVEKFKKYVEFKYDFKIHDTIEPYINKIDNEYYINGIKR